MHYLYILLLKNNQLYTGVTNNLRRRYQEHLDGKVTSTKLRRPIRLIHYEAYLLKEDAIRRERYLKTNEGRKFLRRQISTLLQKLNLYKRFARG